jgi:selenocysteine lyase/cysteine desulfurase
MLTHAVPSTESFFAELRQRDFARLDASGVAYLDYAGSALYAESQIDAHRSLLTRSVFGNPHSEHAASRASTSAIEAARRQVLRFLDATTSCVSPPTPAPRSSSSPRRTRSAAASPAC